ncbi:ExeM/NucH family extracellular endonuclease [Psychromonas antarctica]|uniref:ExeM/NucH family extracellular endonuclease n=1 Tax=Psychromonas antarctica TaxID=67573 RepID=UPI001EE85180|nr:ExeM/NucH family extracellular endonuclease [Psychromonas antarctica]MCG6201195.1 ExeM/NucH family extracellular endonuclease [Psychromonas antarctica]
MKKKILALAIGSVLSAGANAALSDIIISEYVEGSGNNKMIELTNLGAADYTFPSNVTLEYSSYHNDIYNAAKVNVLEGQKIDAGKTLVIYNGETEAEVITAIQGTKVAAGTYAEAKYNAMNYSGDDHVALMDGSTIVDVIGTFGDSGNDWGKDKTFRRRLAVGDASPAQNTAFDANNWLEEPLDTLSGLGDSTLAPYVAVVVAPSICGSETLTTIGAIQGSENSSLLADTTVFVQGVVTAVAKYPVKGLYLQDAVADGNIMTSDGIFVKTSKATDDLIGNTICLTSKVVEDYGLTELETDEWDVTDTSSSVPAATDITMIPEDLGSFKATLERYEGMLVNLPSDIDPATDGNQDMRVTKAFGFDYNSYRNNLIFSYLRPNMVPTQNNVAGSEGATAAHEQNKDYRLIIESPEKAADGEIPYYPDFATDPAKNYIRINDSVTDMEGVIAYSYGDFTLVVTNQVDKNNFKHNDDRSKTPDLSTVTEDGEFAIKIGTMNVLNFFNSPFGGDINTHGDNRGAESDADFQKQKTKIVAAVKGLNVDILGLMEIENNGFGSRSAIKELVDTINEDYYDEDPKDAENSNSTSNRYVFVGYDSNGDLVLDELDSIGGDAITTGLLYRPTKVSIESLKVIPMPEQHAPAIVNDSYIVVKDSNGAALESGDNYQRSTLAVTFKVNQTGKKLTVAVNHLKSKGSSCWEDWQGVEFGDAEKWSEDAPDLDFQGQCEAFRVATAVHLGEELHKIAGDKVVIGDMNTYAQEDALLVLTENTTGKALTTARDTFIGKKPQFNVSGTPVAVTKSYGYINSVLLKDTEKGRLSWSYSYNDEIGTLDHALISPSLKDRLIDAVDWHINAAESTLYDYQSKYKGDHVDALYVNDAYRSSDHDSAAISLSYKYGEVSDGEPVHLVIQDGAIKIPYSIPGSEATLAGDIAEISLSSENDLSKIVLPTVALTEDGQSLVDIEVFGLKAGAYNATMKLVRDGQLMPNFTTSMKIEAAKKDSTTPKVSPPAPYDGSGGGSFGIFGLLSLLGLGFLRRTKA